MVTSNPRNKAHVAVGETISALSVLVSSELACQHCAAILTTLVSLLAYGFSVRLPFFSDDLVHFRWLSATDLVGIWTSARALGYYRPLSFTLWKLLWALQAGYHAPTMHALNIGVHALNSLLVLALLSGLERKRNLLLGLTAAILFSLFPFSYQAVPWVGSLSHPLATALILGALVLGWQRQRHLDRNGRRARRYTPGRWPGVLAPLPMRRTLVARCGCCYG